MALSLQNWLGRAIIFFMAGGGCLISLHYATGHFKSERQVILLNRSLPDFHLFLNIEKQYPTVPSGSVLKEYFDYFHLVTEAMPENSDGHLMLGYLYETTGDHQQAQRFLEEAHQLDPLFFYTEYNLALVLFEQGDYLKSALLLQKALGTSPQATLNRMMNSIIYRQMLASMDDKNEIITGLRQAYNDAYALMVESIAKQKGPQGENAVPQVHAHVM